MSVKHTSDSGIHLITIDNEKALNALNRNIMDQLESIFVGRKWEPGVDVGIIITGAGNKAFVAGADIAEFQGLDENEGRAMSQKGHRIFDAIEQTPIPVIAAVNGFALGGGCELAMACHLRIASEGTRFGTPEVSLGLIPGYGGTMRMWKLIGRTKALEYLLTADMIPADKALELGLINAVVEPENLLDATRKLILKIGSKGPLAVSAIIAALNKYEDGSLANSKIEIEYFGSCFSTLDAKEGISAFLEKRKAEFTGN